METSTHSSSAEATSSATSSADVGAAAASRPTALRHLDISSDATSEPLPNDTASYQTTPSAIKAAETEELKAWEEGQLAISREAEAARERELSEQLEKQAASDLYNWAMSAISGTIDKAEQYHDLMSNLPAIKHLLEDEQLRRLPADFNGHLRPYQEQGYQWLVSRNCLGESGILADEMGLGKTVQVIAFLSWLFQEKQFKSGKDEPVLVIAPLSVVGNWVDEVKRFAPHLPVVAYRGPAERREEIFRTEILQGAPMPKSLGLSLPRAKARRDDGDDEVIKTEKDKKKKPAAKKPRTTVAGAAAPAPATRSLRERPGAASAAPVPSGDGIGDGAGSSSGSDSESGGEEAEAGASTPAQRGKRKSAASAASSSKGGRGRKSMSGSGDAAPSTTAAASPAAGDAAGSSSSSAASASSSPFGGLGAGFGGRITPIVVTSYDFALKDAERLTRIPWKVVVADEGHKLKNADSMTFRTLQLYSNRGNAHAIMKILLTGTPVQNTLMELWSLMHFVMPTVFNDRESFAAVYNIVRPDSRASKAHWIGQEARNRIVSKLHALLARFILRRTKDAVSLYLPPKVECLVYTPLTPEQLALLRGIAAGDLVTAARSLDWRLIKAGAPSSSSSASSAAAPGGGVGSNPQMRMRQVCCHPFILAEPHDLPYGTTDDRIISSCGKMVVLHRMLTSLRAGGHKVLIFSQFTDTIAVLADYLEHVGKEALGEYRVLTGSSAGEERDEAIRSFNNDPKNDIFTFLLSTKAGGLGINLTAADTVIFFDSDWNPKNDDQAMDRAHRIGQTRPVVVYRLVTEGASVERALVRRAAGKSGLSRMVLQEGKGRLLTGTAGGAASGGQVSPGVGDTSGGRGTAAAGSDSAAVDDVEISAAAEPARVGLASEKLLSFWLREDVSDRTLITGGISAQELGLILDRPRALQAGQRVADEVEARLQAELQEEERQESGGAGAASAGAGNGAAASPSASASSPAAASFTTAPPAPSSAASPSEGAHLSVPDKARARAGKKTIASAEAEQVNWRAWADAAPFTPSKGAAYEFVYNAASKGLLTGMGMVGAGVAPAADGAGSAHALALESTDGGSGAFAVDDAVARQAASAASPSGKGGPGSASPGAGHAAPGSAHAGKRKRNPAIDIL